MKSNNKYVLLGQIGSIDFYAKINVDEKDVFEVQKKEAIKMFGEMWIAWQQPPTIKRNT